MNAFEKILSEIDNGIKTIEPLMKGDDRQIAESQIIGLEEARKNLIPLSRTMKDIHNKPRRWECPNSQLYSQRWVCF